MLRLLPDASVDSIVTDPPYELGFMGKQWDASGIAYAVEMWRECLRVAKPGAYLLAFGGTRTSHRMVCAIEDAGWETRDCIAWVHAQGFPKSLDVGKAIDKAAGAEREKTTPRGRIGINKTRVEQGYRPNDVAQGWNDAGPATTEAQQWDGWGTALKPAWENICVARKPFPGTVAANVLAHGTGALNIDGCRIPTDESWSYNADRNGTTFHGDQGERIKQTAEKKGSATVDSNPKGRYPANFCHGSDEVLALFPVNKPGKMVRNRTGGMRPFDNKGKVTNYETVAEVDDPGGSTARFFYCAKASKHDRGPGNEHPTVKPTALMQWLVRLVTPPGGTVLDPFVGSGTTLLAAEAEGFSGVGIEADAASVETIYSRLQHFGVAVVPGELYLAALHLQRYMGEVQR